MIWAILADVHGNLEALQAVAEDCRREGIDGAVFLGDAVGYGANPNECLAVLKDLADLQVAGNHDCGAAGRTTVFPFLAPARTALDWTARILTEENRAFLRGLALVERAGQMTLVHAALHHPEEWAYIFSEEEAEKSLSRLTGRVLFVGHSHRPLIVVKTEAEPPKSRDPEEVVLEPGKRYLINPGSVGQPRDSDPRAAYGLYEEETGKYRLKRIPYDIRNAQEKILKAGLPVFLARRLSYGQ